MSDNDNGDFGMSDDAARALYARDAEEQPGPLSYGSKFISGGGGEGTQQLDPEGGWQFRQEVKTDAVLPAYCDPPNPCPKGYSGKDGCLEEFQNTAEFSRKYQGSQDCMCDEEHMQHCNSQPQQFDNLNDAIESYLAEKNMENHATLVAKKGNQAGNPLKEHYPRKKRSVHETKNEYDWLKGDPLKHRVAKKG